jgi:hypothetical protein
MGIDKKIIEVVAILNLIDIKTTQSCEGHLDRALPYPWVQIGSIHGEQLNEKRQKMFEIRKVLDEKVQRNLSEKDFAEIRDLESEISDLIGTALSKPIELLTSFYKTKGGGEGNNRRFCRWRRFTAGWLCPNILSIEERQKNCIKRNKQIRISYDLFLDVMIYSIPTKFSHEEA